MGNDEYHCDANAQLGDLATLWPARSHQTLNPQVPGSSPGGPTDPKPQVGGLFLQACDETLRRLSPSSPRLGRDACHEALPALMTDRDDSRRPTCARVSAGR